MRVLHFHQTDQGGGGAKIVRSLHRGINTKENKTSTLIVGNKQNDIERVHELSQYPLENIFNYAVERIFSLEGLGSPSSFKIPRLIDEYSPDIIHLHNIHGGYFNLLNVSKLPDELPLVWTFHDMWPLTGHCTYSFDCQKYQHGCGNCPYLDTPMSIKFDTTKHLKKLKSKIFSKRDPTIVTPSKWLGDKVDNSDISNLEKCHIPHGIDTEKFSPLHKKSARNKFNIPNEDRVLLFIANSLSNRRKGMSDLIQALNELSINNLSILIVGGKNYSNLNISSEYDIYNPGYISNDMIPSAYSAADICVIPSWYESFGLVATESMACETPVVVYNTSGLKEQINSSVGRLADFRNPNSLSEKISELYNNEDLISIGKRARRRVLNRYNKFRFIEDHINLYNDVV